jgi:bifunctional non-homologous end joining protein LigD
MCLRLYQRKRDFRETPEPRGEKKTSANKRIFVVQRHQSSILHFDLRIEVNGVLKSWAMPKGPSMNCNDKRLAIMVEDHPISYASFKGKIPEGNYGAGTVERWDKGSYIPHNLGAGKSADREILKQIREGRLKFTLRGSKLKGVFTLVRLNGPGSNAWILIKGNDKFAVDFNYNNEFYTSSIVNKGFNYPLYTGGSPSNFHTLV